MFTDQDKKNRLLKRLAKLEQLSFVNSTEIASLIEVENYTQAFLTQWMAVEKSTKHLSKVSSICLWCEKTFETLHKSLGDIGYKQETLEKKIFDTLYTKYAESRSSGFDKININQFKKSLNILKIDFREHDLNFLLASNAGNDSAAIKWPNSNKKTIRRIRNELIHNNGRINKKEYENYSPFFNEYFSLIDIISSQICLFK